MDLSIVESHRGKSVAFVGETRESEEQDKVPNENGEVSSEDEDKANNEQEDDEGNEEERESDDSVSRETGYRKKSLGTTFLKISFSILSKFRLNFKQIHSLILLILFFIGLDEKKVPINHCFFLIVSFGGTNQTGRNSGLLLLNTFLTNVLIS